MTINSCSKGMSQFKKKAYFQLVDQGLYRNKNRAGLSQLIAFGVILSTPCYALASHSIQGVVSDSRNAPLEGIPMALSKPKGSPNGSCTATTTSGGYSCQVEDGFVGTIRPDSTTYTFRSLDFSGTPVTSNLTGQDFKADVIEYSIQGTVTDSHNTPLVGVPMTLSSPKGTPGGSCTATVSSGEYSCLVEDGFVGEIRPDTTAYTFTPLNFSGTPVTSDLTGKDFKAALVEYSIRGTVTDSHNTPLVGISMALSKPKGTPNGSCSSTTTNGEYSCHVEDGFKGTIWPDTNQMIFPVRRFSDSPVIADLAEKDFQAIASNWVRGRITDSDGLPISNVAVSGEDGLSVKCESSNSNGEYSCLVINGYASKLDFEVDVNGYFFHSIDFSSSPVKTDRFGLDVQSIPLPHRISGVVTDPNGGRLSSVQIRILEDGFGICDQLSDNNGFYSCLVEDGFSGVLHPSFSEDGVYLFSDVTYSDTPITNDLAGQNIQALVAHTVSGNITDYYGNSLSLINVRLSGSGHSNPGCFASDPSGQYSCLVEDGFAGKITPEHPDYLFSGIDFSYLPVTEDLSGKNIQALLTRSVIGTITDNQGRPLSGAYVSLGGNGTCGDLSGYSGKYSCLVEYGYASTVKPSIGGHLFSGIDYAHSPITQNLVEQNIQALTGTHTVSGTITDSDGMPLTATKISSKGTSEGTCDLVGTNGDYSCLVEDGYTGSIQPVVNSYEFSGKNFLLSPVSSDLEGIDIAATERHAVNIRGNDLTTTEAGIAASFRVFLNKPCTADVAIQLSSSDTSEGIVSPTRLTFTPSNWDTVQTVTVTGVDDAVMDGDIAYFVRTSAVTSADANYHDFNPTDVSVTNRDNESESLEQKLIEHYYNNILGRSADQGGMDFWDGENLRLRNLAIESKEAFIVMAVYFFSSPEYLEQNTSDETFIGHLYRTFFNREADSGGRNYWLGQIAAGMPREILMFNFLFSSEFNSFMTSYLADNPSRSEMLAVIDFYRGGLNRIPESDGLNYWVGAFRQAQCASDEQVAGKVYDLAHSISSAFFNSEEYLGRNRSNSEYVSDLYNAFLRRGGDLDGVNYWINALNAGKWTREDLRFIFSDSEEFSQRVQEIANESCMN